MMKVINCEKCELDKRGRTSEELTQFDGKDIYEKSHPVCPKCNNDKMVRDKIDKQLQNSIKIAVEKLDLECRKLYLKGLKKLSKKELIKEIEKYMMNTNEKLVAIFRGGFLGDDLSVDHLVVPKSVNLKEEYKEYEDWYIGWHRRKEKKPEWTTFADWLIRLGGRKTNEKDIEIFDET